MSFRPKRAAVPLALGAAAFSLAAVWIVLNPQEPLPDPTLYEGIGANLAAGNGFSFDEEPPYRPEITRTPFVPAMIAALYTFTGRNPEAVLWLQAVLVALAVVAGWRVMLELTADRRVAALGGAIAVLCPFVAGVANNILTEPAAMLQIALGAWLLLRWPRDRERRSAPWRAALLGLLLASLVLNRANFTPAVLIAAGWAVLSTLRRGPREPRSWLTAAALCVALGAPVLGWSARNHSLGLSFSPAPVGLYASRVLDIKRYKDVLCDEDRFRQPRVNRLYFLHWKLRYGPQRLLELERRNREWFERWLEGDELQVLAAMPARALGLFSSFRISIFPIYPPRYDRDVWPVMRWISRGFWLLSFLGLLALWKRPGARWLWLVPVLTLVPLHLWTVCHPRYMTALMPLLMPYGGAALLWAARRARPGS